MRSLIHPIWANMGFGRLAGSNSDSTGSTENRRPHPMSAFLDSIVQLPRGKISPKWSIWGLRRRHSAFPGSSETVITWDLSTRGIAFDSLSKLLTPRYDEVEAFEDLQEAIQNAKNSAETAITTGSSLYQGVYMTNLGSKLFRRYKITHALEDLQEAIRITDESIEIRAADMMMGDPFSI